ncbi:MAG: catechol 2,3-dioxygenase-like lactoylglutathione lyase family enzyme [Planctomycetota bacterium]|jgi:catechol 2,3-dioxygenase-like lactoylglutathione lyase family enzyme
MGNHPNYQLDHVHILVADREKAAAWYERTFGFACTSRSEDPYGPLVISGDGGKTGLALFTSRVAPDLNRVVAFRIDGSEFLAFASRLTQMELYKGDGKRVVAGDVADHGDVLSYYFTDPDGNAFELATYDVEDVRRWLRGLKVEPVLRP